MAVTTQTTAILTNLPKTVYDKALLSRALPLLSHDRWGMRVTVPKGMKSLEKRRHERLTIPAVPNAAYSTGVQLAEGTTPADSYDPSNPTVVTCTPVWYGAFMQLADYLLAVSIDNLLAEYTELLGDHSGTCLDRVARNTLVAATNIQYAGGATSVATIAASDIPSYGELLELRMTMENNNVAKIGGLYYQIISPATWRTYMLDADIRERVIYTEDKVFNTGQIPSVAGIAFVLTSEAYTEAGTLVTTVHHSLTFGAEAYAVIKHAAQPLETITKAPGSSGTADPLNQRGTIGWKASKDVKILNQNFMVDFRHAVAS